MSNRPARNFFIFLMMSMLDPPVAAALGPPRDLLAHGAAGHKHGGWLAQQLGDLLLERGDQLALPVAIELGLGRGELGQVE